MAEYGITQPTRQAARGVFKECTDSLAKLDEPSGKGIRKPNAKQRDTGDGERQRRGECIAL